VQGRGGTREVEVVREHGERRQRVRLEHNLRL
jgi:hypothetical protein